MLFAAYADAGAGLAFLLLLTLSTIGLAILGVRAWLESAFRHRPGAYLAAASLLQAWPVYLWARISLAESRHTVEWVWLVSLALAAVGCVSAYLLRR